MTELFFDKPNLSNDNDKVASKSYFRWLRKISQGNFQPYLNLGDSYENGYSVKKDMPKALKAYEKYYEAYKKLVPPEFNVIEFLVGLGNKYKSIGNNYRAAEWYLEASMYIMQRYNSNEQEQETVFKHYELERLLKETGCHNIV